MQAITDSNQLIKELKEWIQWAQKKANWYNPNINEQDELLDFVDKDTLTLKKPLKQVSQYIYY